MPITAKLVANLLVSAGANRVLTMDLHSQQIQGFFDIPVDHLYASPVFFEYLKTGLRRDNLVVCSPDVGGMKMAAAYADVLGASLGMVAKKRRSATTVEAINVVGEVDGPRHPARRRHHGNRRHPGRRGDHAAGKGSQAHPRGGQS